MQVAYIDTEGTFRAEKIRAIAGRFDLDADAVLDNVRCSSPHCFHALAIACMHSPGIHTRMPAPLLLHAVLMPCAPICRSSTQGHTRTRRR